MDPSSGRSVMALQSRARIRVSHLHQCHRVAPPSGGPPVLLFTVVQGHCLPCSWAQVYALLPDQAQLISRHFRFDSQELETYRQLQADPSLRWMDTEFMFQLALDLMVGQIRPLLANNPEYPSVPQQLEDPQLLLLHLSGQFPQLDQLLDQCGEHYLLYRQLQALKGFPKLRSDASR
jgi:hypothetical protein